MTTICSIHGRFQPFHNGHLQYFQWALQRFDLVYIGITQIYGQSNDQFPGAPHRGNRVDNPLSLFDRARLIEAALITEGYELSRFRTIPFPIEDEESLHLFLPRTVTCCTTIHSEWNHEKIAKLERLGYRVEILASDETGVNRASGSEIRQMIRGGNAQWRSFVPIGAANLIEAELLGHFSL